MTKIATFFHLTKIGWYIMQPSNFIIVMILIGLLVYWRRSTRRGTQIIFAAAIIYIVGGLSPLGNALLLPLEQSFTRDKSAAAPAGIVVLGGVVDTITSTTRDEVSLTDSAERLTEAVALARRYPQAKIVFSGGDGALVYKTVSETDMARRFFAEMGVDAARIVFEDTSRTTYENALYTRQLVTPKPGERWLLVTSAFHMPRAHRCFVAAGFDTVPWPIDYRTRGPEDLFRFPPRASEGWRRIDLAVKEWIGLIAYRVTGSC